MAGQGSISVLGYAGQVGNHLNRATSTVCSSPAPANRRTSRFSRWRAATARAERIRARATASSARTAATRHCSPTPTSRPSTSHSRTPSTSTGRSARSRPASTSCARSRSAAARPRSNAPSTSPSANDRLLMEAFMYRHNPQTRRLSELVARRGGRPDPHHPRRVRLRRRANRPTSASPGARRRGADGRRVLLRERRAADRRRARARRGRAGARRRRRRRRVRRRSCDSEATSSRTSTPASRSPAGTCSRSSATRARSGSTTLALPRPGDRARRDEVTERIEIEPGELVPARGREHVRGDPRRGQPLLGRADAVGQARTIEALYQAADTGRTVSLCS